MKVFVFVALKIAEVGGFISIIWAFTKLGEIYNAFSGLKMSPACPAWLGNLLIGIFVTFLAVIVIGLIGQFVFWTVKENLKLAKGINKEVR